MSFTDKRKHLRVVFPMSYTEPALNCDLCPRLADFRAENQGKFPDKHNAPVPAFGALDAQLLVVGLARRAYRQIA